MSTRKSARPAIGPSDRPPGIRTGGAAVLEVGGVVVGHHTDAAAGTGCTVIAFDPAVVVGVDIRGSAPGTREVALLDPQRHISQIDAIVLCGGSALGLGAASGVAEALRARNRGFPTPGGPVPIVPAAVVFDLTTGKSAWPQPHDGAAALERASSEFFACGNVGAGTGVTAGPGRAGVKSGLGAALASRGRLKVGAIAAVNPVGTVLDEHGRPFAGLIKNGAVAEPEAAYALLDRFPGNTIVAVILCNADLDKLGATKVAQMAHDGLARAVRPAHTIRDGDTVFAAAGLGAAIAAPVDLAGSLAADALAAAIRHGVRSAQSDYGIAAVADLGGPA